MSKDSHFLFHSTCISETALILDSDEVTHLSSVLRFSEGDEIQVTDGNGRVYECTIRKMKRDSVLCEIRSSHLVAEKTPNITLAIGFPDKERFDMLCETLPPLGVRTIIPLITDHCRKPWWDTRWEKSQERFNRKIISSMKQSRNPYQTTVTTPMKSCDVVNIFSPTTLIADPNGQTAHQLLQAEHEKITVLIGPPGGFSEQEHALFCTHGAQPLFLGTWRLRTELAAITAASLCAQMK